MYQFASQFAASKLVLDAGCGYGYGSYELSKVAREVVGIDKDCQTIETAKERYQKDGLLFEVMDVTEMTFVDSSFDLVVSLEVIEHIEKVDEFLAGVKRVLKPGGAVIFSTPNKRIRDRMFKHPYHVREFYREELSDLLKACFPSVELYSLVGTDRFYQYELSRLKPEKTSLDFLFQWVSRADVLGIRRVIKKPARENFVHKCSRLVKRIRGKYVDPKSLLADDFEVIMGNTDNALNIIAVCKNL